MTIKEAIIKSLEDINALTNYMEVCNHIITKGYYNFKTAKTPTATVSALLGDFIRSGDTRVKRIKKGGGNYYYYLAKIEEELNVDIVTEEIDEKAKIRKPKKTYAERDLHILLSPYRYLILFF